MKVNWVAGLLCVGLGVPVASAGPVGQFGSPVVPAPAAEFSVVEILSGQTEVRGGVMHRGAGDASLPPRGDDRASGGPWADPIFSPTLVTASLSPDPGPARTDAWAATLTPSSSSEPLSVVASTEALPQARTSGDGGPLLVPLPPGVWTGGAVLAAVMAMSGLRRMRARLF
jgi:hypothetical protein